MKKYILSFLLLPIIGLSQFEEIKTFQKNLIKKDITGSNVAMVYKKGEIIYKNTVNSKKEGDRKISTNTIFPIWSMSKPITIVAMMTLFEEGKINFNDNVSKYLPSFKKIKCKDKKGKVYDCKNSLKIIHLMTHRSGYKYYKWNDSNPSKGYSSTQFINTSRFTDLTEFTEEVSKQPLEFEPGTEYLYGINQAILGGIIESVTGIPFYEYLKLKIFDPLEMFNTKFYLTSEERKRFQPLYINSGALKGFTYLLDELSYDINNKAHFGGEGLVSTFGDYSNFCAMLLNGGKFNGSRIISKSSIEMMTKKYSDGDDDSFYYGFSVFVLGDSGKDGRNSSKGIFGWSGYHNTHFWIDPRRELFALFMTRAREYSDEIRYEFMEAVYSSIY